MTPRRPRLSPRRVARLLAGPAIFAVVLVLVDVPTVLDRLRDLHVAWVVVALAIAALQILGSAWRWRFTARRLGVGLPMTDAVREYWLAGFLNQVLPGGVVGDVSRAIRHATDLSSGPARDVGPADSSASRTSSTDDVRAGHDASLERRAIHAVVLERLSGQMVVVVAAGMSAAYLLTAASGVLVLGLGGLLVTFGVLANRARRRPAEPGGIRFVDSLRFAVLHPDALGVQVLTSTALVASYIAGFLVASRSVGIETPIATLLPLVTPVLVAMLVPVSVAGWGVREGAAAAIWAMAGLPAGEGVAISVAYGLLVLVGSLPGAVVLLVDGVTRARRPVPGGRDRTEDRTRVGGAAPVVGSRRRGGPPAGG